MKAYLSRLDDISKPLTCELCGLYPKFLGFDGVSLAMRKKNVDWKHVETIYPKSPETKPLDPAALKQSERMMLSSRDTQKLLLQFCTGVPTVTENIFNTLVENLSSELPPLELILRQLLREEQVKMQGTPTVFFSFPGIWKELLHVIATPTSATWILRPAILPAVQHLIETKVYLAAHHKVIAPYCPPLTYLLLRIKGGVVSDALAALLKAMVEKVKLTHPSLKLQPFIPTTTNHINISLLTNAETDRPSDARVQKHSPGSLEWIAHIDATMAQLKASNKPLSTGFSNISLNPETIIQELPSSLSGVKYPWPSIRKMERTEGYDEVKQTSSDVQQWSDATNEKEDENIFCHKVEAKGYSLKDLIAGLFIACCLHGIGYGFHCMVAPEGRKDLMKVLYERMPQAVLDELCVVYDFNCQEGEYMLNRKPEMFQHTRLFIDRWHSMSHKCASIFKLDSYPNLQELISTSSESLNNVMQRLSSQTPFMTQETFMAVCEGVMGVRNALLNRKLRKIANKYNK